MNGVRLTTLVASTALFALGLGGCPPWSQTDDGSSQKPVAKLVPFDSPGSLLSYFKTQANARVLRRTRNGFPWFALGGASAPTTESDQAGTAGNSGTGSEFSTTNIQEAGVDESDVFKSDGTYFYLAKDKTLRVLRATPLDELAQVGQLDLGFRVESLYLFGDSVIALGSDYGQSASGSPEIMIWPPYYRASSVSISQIDVSNPAAPAVTNHLELDGALVSSRLTNGRLLLVLTIVPNLPETPTLRDVSQLTLGEVMPKLRAAGTARDLVAWSGWLHPESPDGYNMTGIVTLDAANVATVVASVAVLANAGTIYASTDALYLTDSDWDPDDNYREKTAIHKFALGDDGAATYVASGSVPGRVLNQFSLGEYQGYLRIATHIWNPVNFPPIGIAVAAAPGGAASSGSGRSGATSQSVSSVQSYSAVYVLGQSAASLDIVGQVDNIAPNEELHSARFLGDHGFLVTYRKVDPLFVLDLTNPAVPKVLGELKVAGFSDYLHPLDSTHLIGVGKWTVSTNEGFDWYQGVQISLFDVSDWTNPTVVQQVQLGGRGSAAETDQTHKGFTFLPQSNLLALPMRLTTTSTLVWDYGNLVFDGVVTYRVDAATGFTELGRLASVTTTAPSDYFFYWSPEWRRAAFIGNTVYALSPEGVRAAPITDFGSPRTLTLPE